MNQQLMNMIFVAVGTGLVSTASTVLVLRVHIDYLREKVKNLDARVRDLETSKV